MDTIALSDGIRKVCCPDGYLAPGLGTGEDFKLRQFAGFFGHVNADQAGVASFLIKGQIARQHETCAGEAPSLGFKIQ